MNPLDLDGPSFLWLYVCLAGVAATAVILLQSFFSRSARPAAAGALNPVDLAYLAGGPVRAADAVLVGFAEAGALHSSEDGKRLVFHQGVPVPAALQPFQPAMAGAWTRKEAHAAFEPALRGIAVRLARFGLVPSADRLAGLWWATLIVLAVPLGLGGLKVLVGLWRDRPVGFLVLLLIGTALLLHYFLRHPPRCTTAGAIELRQQRLRNERAARAPMPNEMALAFALSGAVVLAGTPHAALGKQMQPVPASSDSGCGGGGDSGGDGGGDSGCGGCGGGGGE